MNKKRKGQRKELLAQKELQYLGWKVIFKAMTVKMGPFFKGHDFADLFDVVAVGGTPTRANLWRFISVKVDGKWNAEEKRKILEFANKSGIKGMFFELWNWRKAAYRERGKDRHFIQAHWEKEIVWS